MIISWEGNEIVLDFGALLIAGACLAWGIDNNVTRKLSSSDPVMIAMIKGLAAGSVNVVLAFQRGATAPPIPFLASAAIVGFLGGMSRLMLKSGKRRRWDECYAAFAVWTRCWFAEVALAFRSASAAFKSGNCL